MADLVLHDDLVEDYLKYKFNDSFDHMKIRQLLKHIHTFYLKKNHPLMSDPSSIGQLDGSDPLIEISDEIDDSILVQTSRLKIMLINKVISPLPSFTTLNILNINEKLKLKYGATYPNQLDKNKAQEHIKALLSDAVWIKITDSYIDYDASQWLENKSTITNIIPKKVIDLTIVSGSQTSNREKLNSIKEEELRIICSFWIVKPSQILNTNRIHDRYIETDKVRILLSSGLYHLSSTSTKDFTYVIELK